MALDAKSCFLLPPPQHSLPSTVVKNASFPPCSMCVPVPPMPLPAFEAPGLHDFFSLAKERSNIPLDLLMPNSNGI